MNHSSQKNAADFIDNLRSRQHRFSRVVGLPTYAQIEYNSHENRVDHVWITLQISEYGQMRAAVNTLSHLNRDAGFDERVRVGTLKGNWEILPEAGVYDCDHLDYLEIESAFNVFYEYHTKPEMEALLTRKAENAILIEVWGEIYVHTHAGVHQIHSRRASCAVRGDIKGKDGALKFYYGENQTSEMLLFKFCGQP